MDSTQPSGPDVLRSQREPQLLLQLEPRVDAFRGNFVALIRRSPRSQRSVPFWPDVFISTGLPRTGLAQSTIFHLLLIVALYGVPRIPAPHRTVTQARAFEHTAITYYRIDDYLPAIKSREEPAPGPVARAADPLIVKQQVRSLPPTPEHFKQRVISPEQVKLPTEQALPNLVASSAALPAPPVTSAERFNRDISLDRSAGVVAPAAEDLARVLGKTVAIDRAAVPPSVADANAWPRLPIPDIARNAVPPAPGDSARDLNRALAAGITARPAVPPVAADAAASTRTSALTLPVRTAVAPVASDSSRELARSAVPLTVRKDVVPPPPADVAAGSARMLKNTSAVASLATAAVAPSAADTPHALGSSDSGVGNIGQRHPAPAVVADSVAATLQASAGGTVVLGLHPAAPSGPIEVPHGNLNGAFEAGPKGKPDASGAPELFAGGTGLGGRGSPTSTAPSGLEVTGEDNKSATPVVVASAAPPTAAFTSPAPVSPLVSAVAKKLFASVRRPHIDDMTAGTTPGGGLENGHVDEQVFHSHRFYQMALNMPNFNSASGSWIIRFAEIEDARSSDELVPPEAVVKVDPAYPVALVRDGVEGVVTLYAVIHADGSVGAVRVLNSADQRLDEFARTALSGWKFRPASRHGTAVELEAVVQIPFRARKIHF